MGAFLCVVITVRNTGLGYFESFTSSQLTPKEPWLSNLLCNLGLVKNGRPGLTLKVNKSGRQDLTLKLGEFKFCGCDYEKLVLKLSFGIFFSFSTGNST